MYIVSGLSAEEWLVERAYMLMLSKREMTALIGGLRVLDANTGHSQVCLCVSHHNIYMYRYIIYISIHI